MHVVFTIHVISLANNHWNNFKSFIYLEQHNSITKNTVFHTMNWHAGADSDILKREIPSFYLLIIAKIVYIFNKIFLPTTLSWTFYDMHYPYNIKGLFFFNRHPQKPNYSYNHENNIIVVHGVYMYILDRSIQHLNIIF